MIKITYDFCNLEEDIAIGSTFTYNSVITLGLQESFEIFQNSKGKFVEGCMMLDIYTNTIKEVIDALENKIDLHIDNTTSQSDSFA